MAKAALRRALFLLLATVGLALVLLPGAAAAEPRQPSPPAPAAMVVALPNRAPSPAPPVKPTAPSINLNVNGTNPDGSKPATSLVIMMGLTVLSVAPALLLLCTSFTKIFMVLGITRNALGLTSMPPNQVLAGLALFLSLFIMGPTVSAMNQQGVQPYLKGDKTQSVAFHDGVQPLRDFMWKTTREDEVGLMIKLSGQPKPTWSGPARSSPGISRRRSSTWPSAATCGSRTCPARAATGPIRPGRPASTSGLPATTAALTMPPSTRRWTGG